MLAPTLHEEKPMTWPAETDIQQYLPQLQEIYLEHTFAGRQPTLTLTQIVPDRRSHRKLARSLVARGFVQQIEVEQITRYILLPAVLQTLAAEPLNLCDQWTKQLDKRSAYAVSTWPWLNAKEFTLGQKRAILDTTDYDFYVVSRDVYSDWGSLAEERATLLERSTNRYQRYWDGPFAEFAQAQRIVAGKVELLIAVSSEQLRRYVAEELERRQFQSVYRDNVLWGLVACGIVDRSLVFDDSDAPRLDRYFRADSHLLPYLASPARGEEANWETNLQHATTQLTADIARLNDKLAALCAISTGIQQYGGWEKFKQRYAQLLKQHLSHQQPPSPNTEST
jgi:hypothetical protein